MAALPYSIGGTPVFSRNDRYSLHVLERTAAALSEPGPHGVRVVIPIGADSIELIYRGKAMPRWAETVLRSLPERWGSYPGWDGHAAVPTHRRFVVDLLNTLTEVMTDDSPVPQITALPDGGAQAEWHGFENDLEIVVQASESPSYYFFNRVTEDEEENVMEGNEPRVRALIGNLR
jgi:hypothetical protein